MDFLINLYENLKTDEIIKKNIQYRINSSSYRIGQSIRYIEYTFINSKKKFKVSSIETDEILDEILSYSETFKDYNNIVNYVTNKYSYEKGDVEEYIDDLIESQIIVSNLEPITLNIDYFEYLHSKIILFKNKYCNIFHELKSFLDLFNDSNTDFSKVYNDLLNFTESIGIKSKNVLNISTIANYKSNFLDKSLRKEIQNAFNILNMICVRRGNKNISKFIKKFKEKYDTEILPLSIVLDEELGIGYIQNSLYGFGDNNPLLKGFEYIVSKDIVEELEWHTIHDFF
ncbi:lantibiotic dehydratase [Chryseobacterium sp. 3008163]|uniref:lantibiotic dehydratase n=1 Tax=Chryseobacterium sp. 3008163 TaxID=2478663 RepID=UPI000F0D081C|nr:lantibiotic dehydratase [Chryseobacterium sp. 3008163]AYN02210.1 hypothetical protein EAG08_19620 [Chryseobacterium sp. 3008163]